MADSTEKNEQAQTSNNTAEKLFSLKRWNAVALWTWDVQCDVCAICRVSLMDPCLKCQSPSTKVEECVVVWGDCNHAFHNCCIFQWINTRSNTRCPLCNHEWNVQKIGK